MRARTFLPAMVFAALPACAVAPAEAPPPAAAPCVAPPPLAMATAEPAQRYAAGRPVPVFSDPDRKAKLTAAAPKLDEYFAAYASRIHVPGMAVGLVVDGDLVWSKGYGVKDVTTKEPVDADTLFRLASLTKSFTATAVLQLRDAGKLSLDDPAAKYLPELAGLVYPTRDAPRITVRHLVSHTAGLPHEAPLPADDAHPASDAAVLGSLQGLVLERAPGSAYGYSNLGFQLAGMIVGRVAGTTYAEYLAAHVLRPLGMPSTGFEPPAARVASGYVREGEGVEQPPRILLGASPAGGLFSSVRDMARYASFELSAWPPRDDGDAGPLRRSSIREAQQMSAWMELSVPRRAPGKDAVAIADGYGFGWVAEQTCEFDHVVWHNGALTDGYRSMLMLLPERGVAIVVLANLFDEHMSLEAAVRGAAHLLDASRALAGRVFPPTLAQLGARESVLALRTRWDDALAARTFPAGAGRFLLDVKKSLEEDVRDHGACQTTSTSAQGPSGLKWEMACDRGGESWEIRLDGEGERIGWFHGEDRFPPDPRLAKAAGILAGLVGRWDDRTYDAQVPPAKGADDERAKAKAAFAAAHGAHGGCKVDHIDERGDKTHGRFELACTRGGPMEMRATLDDKTGKVTSVKLGEPEAEGTRCP